MRHFNITRIKSWHLCTLAKETPKRYTDTVILPKTAFKHHLNAKQTQERDRKILEECNFAELYAWQKSRKRAKDFTLLDGPPYANGKVHIGHAINKIVKDIIIRSELLKGRRITFVPGWDCHGLPIELKALGQKEDGKLQPQEIRKKAREFARSAMLDQKAAFRSWGVMADWDREVYHTYDKKYVTDQLQTFWQIHEHGLLYRDLKPVYWSPSSRTALAEAELVYKDHISPGVTLRLETVGADLMPSTTSLYLLVWTTTPWTLPLNQAVCCSKTLEYSVVSIAGWDGFYLVASELVPQLAEKWKREITVVRAVSGESLVGLHYRHPWRKSETKRVLTSGHVTAAGTGLVHAAPAHGHDDFVVGLRNGLHVQSHVDGEGKYSPEAGEGLAGLSVQGKGSEKVLERLADDVIHLEKFQHSYPYDWRTDKPVIIRASHQWFIDTSALKESALECLSQVSGSTDRLRSLLSSRPYWCVSRQRAWGVPIPAFYHKTSGRPLLSKRIVDSLCRLVAQGNEDAWWTASDEELFPKSACNELCVSIGDVRRGADIMDIWFDSGVAWKSIDKMADVCVEGVDQHTGWFQSLLLTSVAVRGHAPTRCFLTHGFAVDEEGRKMSKSLGNVVDPQAAVSLVGVDALRWWVATNGHHSQAPASDRLLQSSREVVTRLRGTLRFLLGALNNTTASLHEAELVCVVDKYMIDACLNLHKETMACYDQFAWHSVCIRLKNFVADISGFYLHVIKDRLYCDDFDSTRRLSCLRAVLVAMETITASVAPILPHLAEEIQLHHPFERNKYWFTESPPGAPQVAFDEGERAVVERFRESPPGAPQVAFDEGERAVVERARELKAQVDQQAGTLGTSKFDCQLALSEQDYVLLKVLQDESFSLDSQLTELMQVASVALSQSESTQLTLVPAARARCPRCRRNTAVSEDLCQRCTNVLKTFK